MASPPFKRPSEDTDRRDSRDGYEDDVDEFLAGRFSLSHSVLPDKLKLQQRMAVQTERRIDGLDPVCSGLS